VELALSLPLTSKEGREVASPLFFRMKKEREKKRKCSFPLSFFFRKVVGK